MATTGENSEVVFMKDVGQTSLPAAGDSYGNPLHQVAGVSQQDTNNVSSTPLVSDGRGVYNFLRADPPYELPVRKPRMLIKSEPYDGKQDWTEYISHFADCAELGEWDNRTKCLVLAANLRDAARKYYSGLGSDEKKDYDKLVIALGRRFGGEYRQDSWLSRLEMRKRKPGESVADLGDDIWQMAQRAYYDFDHCSQEQLALKHFYRMIDTEMKVKCFENRCSTLSAAVDVFERYEALYEDKKHTRRTHVRAMDSNKFTPTTEDIISKLMKQLERMESRQAAYEAKISRMMTSSHVQPSDTSAQGNQRACYRCGDPGHFIRNCPQQAPQPSTSDRTRSMGAHPNGRRWSQQPTNSQRMQQGNARPSN